MNKSTRTIAAWVVTLVASAASGADAQSVATSLSGLVRDIDGHAVAGAAVTVIGTKGKAETRSSASGAFNVDHLAAGTYLVVAIKDGYDPGVMPHAIVTNGSTAAVDVTLPPDKPPTDGRHGPHGPGGGPPDMHGMNGMPPPPPPR